MNPKIYFTVFPSPIGALELRGNEASLTGLSMEGHHPASARADDAVHDAAPFHDARRQLEEYFAGGRRDFSLTLAPAGTDFQQRVWSALRAIPYGETISYGELARRIGNPRAVRAVGLANGRNPISIIVPCHRVIGADGTLTGYGGGLERKRFLLALESGGLHHGSESDGNIRRKRVTDRNPPVATP
jgi:methylated-DNA-[protein]-cysteine S-methyltransferase